MMNDHGNTLGINDVILTPITSQQTARAELNVFVNSLIGQLPPAKDSTEQIEIEIFGIRPRSSLKTIRSTKELVYISGHVHPVDEEMELDENSEKLLNESGFSRFGIARLPSEIDVALSRNSISQNEELGRALPGQTIIQARELAQAIFTVTDGSVGDQVWYDPTLLTNDARQEFYKLHDKALAEVYSDNPDPKIRAAYYRHLNKIVSDEPPIFVGHPAAITHIATAKRMIGLLDIEVSDQLKRMKVNGRAYPSARMAYDIDTKGLFLKLDFDLKTQKESLIRTSFVIPEEIIRLNTSFIDYLPPDFKQITHLDSTSESIRSRIVDRIQASTQFIETEYQGRRLGISEISCSFGLVGTPESVHPTGPLISTMLDLNDLTIDEIMEITF